MASVERSHAQGIEIGVRGKLRRRNVEVAIAVEDGRKAVLPLSIGLRRDVGHGPADLDLPADGVAVIALT